MVVPIFAIVLDDTADFSLIKCDEKLKKFGRADTALPSRKSNFSGSFSALQQITRTFFRPNEDAISLTTIIFFELLSIRVNCASGQIIARGSPGSPPPVPTSITVSPFLKLRINDIDRQGITWLGIKNSTSFLETRFTFVFQSYSFSDNSSSLSHCSSLIESKSFL